MPFQRSMRLGQVPRCKLDFSMPSQHHAICGFCGKPLDPYHVTTRCGVDYQARLDREAMDRKRGASR
jgi:hypothetical protein